MNLDDFDKKTLVVISDYYQTERYPGPRYFMPEREEIKESLEFANELVEKIKNYINNA
jgi:hypothetical protein